MWIYKWATIIYNCCVGKKQELEPGGIYKGWNLLHVHAIEVLRAFFCCTSLPLAGNLGRLTCIRHSSCRSSTIHSYRCVQYFCVSRQWYGCQHWGFLKCAQMLMHVIAHRDCTDTRRESAPKVDWEKNPLLYWRLKPEVINALGFLFRWATNWAILPHALLFMLWFAVGNWPKHSTLFVIYVNFYHFSTLTYTHHFEVILCSEWDVKNPRTEWHIYWICVHNIVKL